MPVICITTAGDVSLSVRAMKAGAADVLTKPVSQAPLLDALRLALDRSEEDLREEVELNGMRERYLSLSGREREVMALVASGLMNKQVGAELGISEITVKAHRGRMMRKMEARSLARLVIVAARLQVADVSNPHHPLGTRHYPSIALESMRPGTSSSAPVLSRAPHLGRRRRVLGRDPTPWSSLSEAAHAPRAAACRPLPTTLGPPQTAGTRRQRLAALAGRCAVDIERVADATDRDRGGDHHHPHLRQGPVPHQAGPRPADPPGRIADPAGRQNHSSR